MTPTSTLVSNWKVKSLEVIKRDFLQSACLHVLDAYQNSVESQRLNVNKGFHWQGAGELHMKWLKMITETVYGMVWYGIVGFNIPLNTLEVISETISRVRWPTDNVTALKDDG